MRTLPRFYPIFDHLHWLEHLLPLGIKLVQLRLKQQPYASVRQQMIQAQTLCQHHNAQLVVNDYWQLAIELQCAYVHLGQEDLAGVDIAAIKAAGIGLGISTHNEQELTHALSYQPDYIALGPIYPTRVKPQLAQQGLQRIRTWKARIAPLPLVAIGGLSVERAADVLEHGADSLAVISDITQHAHPLTRAQQWLSVTQSVRPIHNDINLQ